MDTNNIDIEFCIISSNLKDKCNQFNCGHLPINTYLKNQALVDAISGNGVTYLAINKVDNSIVAYYTVAASLIPYIDITNYGDEEEPYFDHNIHGYRALEITMFAVSTKYQDKFIEGNLISSLILHQAIGNIYDLATQSIGAKFIILYSVPDAIEFYKRNRFQFLKEYMIPIKHIESEDCTPMYLRLLK